MKTFEVKGKKYIAKRIVHHKGDDTFELMPFDGKEYNKVISDIARMVKKKVNPEEAIKAALGNLEYEEVLMIHKKLKKGMKPKAVKGCYEITVGRHTIPLVQ